MVRELYEEFTKNHYYITELLVGMLVIGSVLGYIFISNVLLVSKKWTFDRQLQKVTIPGRVRSYTVPFDRMFFGEITMEGKYGNSSTTNMVFYPGKGLLRFLRLNCVALESPYFGGFDEGDWNFYSWYMDKNRPLPPGKVFDHCRE